MISLRPFTRGTMYYRVTWNSPNAGHRIHADFRTPDTAQRAYSALTRYLPDARATCGPVIP
jgi:hypothetical protein